ncbi:MAG: neutral/alkaline non-lysosomal ceramidase N-terminal domain-containing protein [Pirellulaceae bacterium]|nr:neutral/alkaline non-lysosomal ceramidase N-terminal domain-containing protein [Pirellulaceae bacterium]
MIKFLTRMICAATASVGLLLVSVRASARERVFQAGAAAVSITPENLPVHSAGSMTPRLARAVHDDLFARCLVLDDGQMQIALVTCDSCMLPRELMDVAKELAQQQTGIPTENILCSATHTHSAVCAVPVFQSPADEPYVAYLTKQIAKAIATAHAHRQPARIGWGVGNAPQHVFNRRWHMRPGVANTDPFDAGTDRVRMNPPANHRELLRPAGPTDPEVSVLAVQSLEGHPLAIWANYSLHYVGGIPGDSLSADYFGYFAQEVARHIQPDTKGTPLIAAMTNGTSGDINNVNFFETTTNRQPLQQIHVVAGDLARVVHGVYQRIPFHDWVPLAMRQSKLTVGVRKPSPEEVSKAKDTLESAGPAPWSKLNAIYANETVHLADFPDHVEILLQAIRIGDLGIVSSPCETFVETGLAIKQLSPLRPTFTIELANGYNGYLPTPQQHALGGYETWRAKSSYLSVDAEPQIRQALLNLLQTVSTPEQPRVDTGAKQPAPIRDALTTIESTRGGRHWVDTPIQPPLRPEESLADFLVEPGLRVELVAAEPLVMDPVWIAFDEHGRMFVAEYADYPTGPTDDDSPPLSRVVMLLDEDGDGQMDRRHVFADQLDFAHSLMPYLGGLLVGAKTEILYLKDTDGDHRADVRETLFSGFTPPHPQMQIGCPQWGMDNWIYFTYGSGDISLHEHSTIRAAGVGSPTPTATAPGNTSIKLVNQDFRFSPLSFGFGAASGFGQFGNTFDQWGRRLLCTNRNPIIHAPIELELLSRNPLVAPPPQQYDVAPSGANSRVFPRVKMKSNYLSHAGTYTSACGTTAYVGDQLGAQFDNSVLVCEPIGHLVSRYVLEPNGAALAANRARPSQEFLTSTDTWFRPVSLANGPDGTLYLADMYRLWVEHPQFLPAEVAQRLDWQAGKDRGRIWRIVSADHRNLPVALTSTPSNCQAVNMLGDSNGWRRELAQRLIVERNAIELAPQLRGWIRQDSNAHAAQRSLWILDGFQQLEPTDVQAGLNSKHEFVRQDSVRLAARFCDNSNVAESVLAAASDASPYVRLWCGLTLGQLRDIRVPGALARLATTHPLDDLTVSAIMSSALNQSARVLERFAYETDTSHQLVASSTARRLVQQLAVTSAACGDPTELTKLLEVLSAPSTAQEWWASAALSGLDAGLRRHQGPLGRTSLAQLLTKPSDEFAPFVEPIRQLLLKATVAASVQSADMNQRLTAIELIAHLPKQSAMETLAELFADKQPTEIQTAALEVWMQLDRSSAVAALLRRWPSLNPGVRRFGLDTLLGHRDTTSIALQAMADGTIQAALVGTDQRAVLLAHPDPKTRQAAQQVLGSAVSLDRYQVVQSYWDCLKLIGDRKAGEQLFRKSCSACHQLGGYGHQVGPDISDSPNRSREALLMDILDPNQKLEPQFIAYQLLTVDGRSLQGLMIAQDANQITLKLADGVQHTVARSEIELLQATATSLMPVGFETDIPVQKMADLLEYLQGSSY